MKKKIHIRDVGERLLYNRLYDDGSNCLAFASGSGCVDKLDIDRYHWQICQGWA